METKEDNILHAIEKTGFIFENTIATIMEKKGWSLIRNRYYVDAQTNNPREVDILAYKTYLINDIRFYFVLLISCKKSSTNDWVFLTNKIKNNDPNFEFTPQLLWTNSKVLKVTNFEEELVKNIKSNLSNNPFNEILNVDRNVFAFQEVAIDSASPKNDSSIYSSIDSILKASKYEIKSCEKRKKNQVAYHYNLVNVFDGDLYEMFINDEKKEIKVENHIKYVNRFIVESEDSFYRFHFTNGNYFPKLIDQFEACFLKEKEIFERRIKEFIINFSKNDDYLNIFRDQIKQDLLFYINYIVLDFPNGRKNKIEEIWLQKSNKKNTVEIYIYVDLEELNMLNNDNKLIQKVKESLLKHCFFEGEIEFCNEPDIPF